MRRGVTGQRALSPTTVPSILACATEMTPFFLFWETGSHYVVKASFELAMQTRLALNSDPPASASPTLGLKACAATRGAVVIKLRLVTLHLTPKGNSEKI